MNGPVVLDDIVAGFSELDPRRGERGMVAGKRTSTPLSRRSIVNLDVLSLTDRRTGALAVLMFWAGRVRRDFGIPRIAEHTVATEAYLLGLWWEQALTRPWGPDMAAEVAALADSVHEARYGVKVRPCPACGEPVRVDRLLAEHGECV